MINLLLRPLVLLLARPLGCIAILLVSFLANAPALMVAAALLQGFQITGLAPAIVGAIVFAGINVVLTNLLEIDGLSYHHLRKALDDGVMPTVQAMTEEEGYVLSRVDCGLPSPTSAPAAAAPGRSAADEPARPLLPVRPCRHDRVPDGWRGHGHRPAAAVARRSQRLIDKGVAEQPEEAAAEPAQVTAYGSGNLAQAHETRGWRALALPVLAVAVLVPSLTAVVTLTAGVGLTVESVLQSIGVSLE